MSGQHGRSWCCAALVISLVWAGPSTAQGTQPGEVIEEFYAVLQQNLQEGQSLGFDGRFERLAPVVPETFDFSGILRAAVGRRGWSGLNTEQREDLVQAFARTTTANYAANFDGGAAQLQIEPGAREVGRTRVVDTTILRGSGGTVELDYVLRDTTAGPRVIDVLLGGTISQLATWRSELGTIFQRRGYVGLLQEMEARYRRSASG